MENLNPPPQTLAAPEQGGGDTAPPAPATPTPPPLSLLVALADALTDTLQRPTPGHHDYERETLHRQAELLNAFFATILKHQTEYEIECARSSTYEWIDLALRVQKQCTDTLKATSAIDYMKSLSPGMPALPASNPFSAYFDPPHPPKNNEQTGEPE